MVQSRDAVFDRIVVDHLVAGEATVSWKLRPQFRDPGPYTFQLYVSETDVDTADDLKPAGAPGVDVFQLTDPVFPRDLQYGPMTTYRVRLTTADGVYLSEAVDCLGRLNKRDWLTARAIVRRASLHDRVRSGSFGWLFKRKRRTELVTDTSVIDFATGEVMRTANSPGVGTDRVGGYFDPVPMQIVLSEGSTYPRIDEVRNMVNDLLIQGRTIAFPSVEHGDVWATATGDARYVIHTSRTGAQVREVPILSTLEMRQLSPTDPVYDLPLPPAPPLTRSGRMEI